MRFLLIIISIALALASAFVSKSNDWHLTWISFTLAWAALAFGVGWLFSVLVYPDTDIEESLNS